MRRHAKRENSGLPIGKANTDGEYKRSAKLRKKRFAGALLRNSSLCDNAEAPDRSVTENRPQSCVRNGKITQSGKKRALHKQPLRHLHKSAAEHPPKKLLAEKTAAFGAQIHNSGGSENRNEHRRGAEKILSMLKKWDGDLSVSASPFEQRDILLYTDYLLTNPRTEKKTVTHPNMDQSFVVPDYSETLFNFYHDAMVSPYFRADYIKQYGDMIVELPDAGEVLLSAMLTLIISGERINPGNIAWAAETGILGDIMQGLRDKQ